MNKTDEKYTNYVAILKEELIPAMGCTEPIALAYAASKAREILGALPEKVIIEASGSIIKNVKSVIVPNTNHLKGMSAAVAAGIVAGDSSKQLEVISDVKKEEQDKIDEFLNDVVIEEQFLDSPYVFDLIVTLLLKEDEVKVRITDTHTNIVHIEKNNEVLFTKKVESHAIRDNSNRDLMDIESIYDFAETCDLDDVKDVLELQIEYNTAIAEEGLTNDYGANIGKVLMKHHPNNRMTRAKARAAAASDARMNGCTMPVVINSGSGNQGITCSLPVIEYASSCEVSHEKLLRALVLSNLVAIHEKTGIGTLSAFCGAVSAGSGAGAGIAYILGADLKGIEHTIVNTLAITAGIVCDGAKASCAAKIASSVDAGILGYQMYLEHQQFRGGDGIVVKGIENTINNIGRLGKEGMKETNKEIIKMMINQ